MNHGKQCLKQPKLESLSEILDIANKLSGTETQQYTTIAAASSHIFKQNTVNIFQ